MLWIGAAHDPSGHADELRGFLRAQERAGHEPALHPLSWTDKRVDLSPAETAMLERQARRRRTAAYDVAVHHYVPTAQQPSLTTAVNVARTMFETDRLPATWLELLLTRDEVWVPCAMNLATFAEGGVPEDRLRVVGETIDFDLFDPASTRVERDDARFTFLTNFDFSSRKGWEVLLRAWARAFDADSGVRLVLKTGSFYRGDDWVSERIEAFLRRELGAGRDRLAPIELRTDVLATADMPGLYASADCYVLASRGEAWGRPYMEALAMGLPTIASAWGGNREFMSPETSWLVDGELVPVPEDADLFNDLYRGHRWFEPDADALAAAMADVARDPEAARRKAGAARAQLLERFGPEAMAQTILEAAAAAHDRHGAPRADRVVLRGAAGGHASLAVVNDGLAGGLEREGTIVRRRPAGDMITDDEVPGISHFWPPDFAPASTGANVVVLPWEFGPPPADWVDQARHAVDRVWVPSAYVRDRHVAAGMPAGIVDVVPNGVDLRRFRPDGPVAELPATAACTFLYVGGTTWRKGADLLLTAWRRAFGAGDDVQLVVKDFGVSTWYRGQTAGDAVRALAADPGAAPVTYLHEDRPAAWLPALYRAADVMVLPYRGEGFCLPALEAMACGVPVIHTGTGPTREFVGDDCGWALPATQVSLSPERTPAGVEGAGHVQEPDLDALVAALRAAAADADDRRRRGAAAHAAAQRHGWDAAARAARASLASIEADGLPPVRTVKPAVVDGRGAVVLYAPRWDDDARWRATLTAWIETLDDGDDVTLALHGGEVGTDELFARVSAVAEACGRGASELPDLALCEPGRSVLSLSMGATAVLVDPADAARPELVRRAARVIPATRDAIAAWRDEQRAAAAAAAAEPAEPAGAVA